MADIETFGIVELMARNPAAAATWAAVQHQA
jgi:hypothetical protein